MTTTLIPVLCAIAAALVTLGLTPAAARLARLVGAVDVPSVRRIHTRPTPRLGGLAICAGATLPVLWFLPPGIEGRGLVVGALLITVLGAVDDTLGLDPLLKLAAQASCAAVPVAAGLTIDHIQLPVVGLQELGDLQYPVTVFWFVAIVNIINFIDGMDGLAAGVAGIGATSFAVIAASLNRPEAAIAAASLAGACAAFLVFNFHPARIFMGDAGSMFLGFTIAGVAVSGVMKSAAAVAVVLPLLVLAIPILDTSFVVLKRLKYRRPVYAADRSHFHHRFFTIGWGQRKTVLAMYAWTALMGGFALAIRFVPYRSAEGGWHLWGTLALGGAGVLALAAAVYLVYVLEILKWRSTPVVTIVRNGRAHRAQVRQMAGDPRS
ncbi:MAG TPA: MraY family glycosyltransferase [Miltoncostaeaceae bacterium]|nr:MraY family glycosyltransferase [Miltoncostaeaceae bacterium]